MVKQIVLTPIGVVRSTRMHDGFPSGRVTHIGDTFYFSSSGGFNRDDLWAVPFENLRGP